jgi:hypothetical protein
MKVKTSRLNVGGVYDKDYRLQAYVTQPTPVGICWKRILGTVLISVSRAYVGFIPGSIGVISSLLVF